MSITKLITEIEAFTKGSLIEPATHNADSERLLAAALSLVSALQPTEDEAWRLVMAPTTSAALKAVIRMGVFDIFEERPMSAEEIATKVGADHVLVVRLMRALLVNHVFTEVGEEQYAHNALSRKFGDKTYRAFLQAPIMNDNWIPKLGEYLEHTKWRNPSEPNNGLLQFANQTTMGTMEWFMSQPPVLQALGGSMTAMMTIWQDSTQKAVSSLFPENFTSDVIIVDVGGGSGNVVQDLRKSRPDLKGNMLFQDVPPMLARAQKVEGVEAIPHDFFTPQPIKDASVYLFRHVFHDWSDEAGRKILTNTVSAMGQGSRIVILDQVVPTRGATLNTVGFDISMMIFAGMERTEKQWRTLLDSVGLKVVRIAPPVPQEGEISSDSTIEAVKKV